MLFSWIREKLFKSKEVLTIDLRMASPSTAISQFYTEFLTTPMSQQWQSSISADDDHYSPMTPTVPSITSTTIPISTTTPIDIHAILHHCTNVIQMWSTFANELVQKAQQDRWFTLLFALIFLCISITIMFIFIKLPNYWSQSCSFQSTSFSTTRVRKIAVQLQRLSLSRFRLSLHGI